MATTISNRIRIRAANVELDAVGGNFSSPTDLGKTSEDGIEISYETTEKEIGNAQEPTIDEIFDIGPQRLTIKCALQEMKATHLALAFGQDTTDVTDNTTATPPNLQVDIGGYRAPVYKALRLKVPQVTTATLYDIFTFYKVKVRAAYQQTFTYKNERYIPVEFQCVQDPANSNKYGKIEIEGASA